MALGDAIYYINSDPGDGGRETLLRWDGHATTDLTPGRYVRNAINEYGGGGWAVAQDDAGVWVVYSAWPGHDLRLIAPDGTDRLLAPGGALRYGSLSIDLAGRQVLAVREDHSGTGEAVNTVVLLSLDGANDGGGQVLASGADFYANPVLRVGDNMLAWVQWNHPNMPWDTTSLRVAPLDRPGDVTVVSEAVGVSTICPAWAPDGALLYLCDASGYWNFWRWDGAAAVALHDDPHDFTLAPWQPNPAPYCVIDADHIACTWLDDGWGKLAVLSRGDDGWALDEISLKGQDAASVTLTGNGHSACAVCGHTNRPAELVRLQFDDAAALAGVTPVPPTGQSFVLPPGFVSQAQAITFGGEYGQVHAWWYPPVNPDYRAPDGELPPVQVWSHGGPTAFASPAFRLDVQFWTTRGIGIVDVNYSGSDGYGRAFRERLKGNWGLADVADCAGVVAALAGMGLADGSRASIRGGSAGGFTTLAALVFTDAFAAGVSLYGVANLEMLATDTHKYESHYLDGLVAPYPDGRDVYWQRSPINHLDKLSCPMLLLQGADDHVVPPSQAYAIAQACESKGLPAELIVFEGEGHGFRKAESLIATESAALAFLGRVHGFTPAG